MTVDADADDTVVDSPEAERATRFEFGHLRRGVPHVVWLLVALNFLVLAAYSVLIPHYRSPDEAQHVDMVVHLQHDRRYPAPKARFLGEGVAQSTIHAGYSEVPSVTPRSNKPLTSDAARSHKPSFDDLGGDRPSRIPNQMGQHPPVYYAGAAVLLRLIPGSARWPFDITVALLRMLSVLMIAPLPLLAFLAVRRLGASTAAGVTAAIIPIGIPQLANIGSSVNNDNLLTLLVAVATLLAVYVVTGDSSWRTAIFLGVIGGVALLTKSLALFIPIWFAIVYIAAWLRGRERRVLVRGVVATGLPIALAAGWYVRNLNRYGSLQPQGITPKPDPRQPAIPYTLGDKGWDWLTDYAAPLFSSRFWVELSVRRTEPTARWIPAWTTVATVVVLTAALIALIVAARQRRFLIVVAAVAAPFAALVLQLLIVTWREYSRSGVPQRGLQGRYFFPGVVGLAALAGIGAAALLKPAAQRWLPVGVLAGAVLLHARAITSVLSWHWNGAADGAGSALGAAAAWAPWPAAMVVLGWLAAIAACIAVVPVWLRTR
ncbi:MAG: glycosyltransferase family 39 protein [Mycobacteriales bacterium]